MNLFKNKFIQALGVGAAIWLCFWAIAIGLGFFLYALEKFSQWYQDVALPASEEIAIACSVIYLIGAAVWSSKEN